VLLAGRFPLKHRAVYEPFAVPADVRNTDNATAAAEKKPAAKRPRPAKV